jgi:Skp family chaperone for outer membrane proteins
MNSKLVLVSALAAGVMTTAGMAQTAGPQAPAAPATTAAAPAPQAVPAKIALIEFEGQKAVADIQKKYEPQKAKLQTAQQEIDSLTKQLQAAPATMPEEEKATRARTIEAKQKHLQSDAEEAQNSYGSDVSEAIGKVAQKLGPVVIKYVQSNGYTMLIDNTGQPQQGGLNVLWAPGTDISQAVVDAYNTTSGVAAPVPSAPSAAARPRPATPAAKPAPKQ